MTRINNVFAVQENGEILEVFTRRSTASAFVDRINENKNYGDALAIVTEKPVVRGTQEVADAVYERSYDPNAPSEDVVDDEIDEDDSEGGSYFDPFAFARKSESDENASEQPTTLITGRAGYGRTIPAPSIPLSMFGDSRTGVDLSRENAPENREHDESVLGEGKDEQVKTLLRQIINVLEG